MQAWHTAMWNSGQLSAPERLAQRDAMLKQRLAQYEAMTAAFKDLYAALTPEQRIAHPACLPGTPPENPGAEVRKVRPGYPGLQL